MGNVSRKMMDDVEAALPLFGGVTPSQVHDRLGCWSLISVRHALRGLVEEGRVTFTGSHCMRKYRRVSRGAIASAKNSKSVAASN